MTPSEFKKAIKSLRKLTGSIPEILRLIAASDDLIKLAELSPSLVELHNNNRKSYPTVLSIPDWLNTLGITDQKNGPETTSLDLGCGDSPRNPFGAEQLYGVDIREDLEKKIMRADLATQPIPCSQSQFDYCTAFDFIEHIPRILPKKENEATRYPFVELMNEIHRVLKPGGLFFHQTPAFPCKQAFQDPTHVNLITEDTIPYYFCEPNVYANKIGYGFRGKFECIGQAWLNTAWIIGVLKALK